MQPALRQKTAELPAHDASAEPPVRGYIERRNWVLGAVFDLLLILPVVAFICFYDLGSPSIHYRDETTHVRAIQERLHSTGAGTHRFCLIRSVERMQDEAANALLKILEEPPPGRIFILTTQQLEGLLPTVVSRCRMLHFSPLPHQELLPLLKDESEEEKAFLLHLAQGAPGVLKHLLADPDSRRTEQALHTAARAFYAEPKLITRLKTLEPLAKRGPDGEDLLRHLFLALREEDAAARLRLTPALLRFAADLETNTHRGLLCTRFAMEVAA